MIEKLYDLLQVYQKFCASYSDFVLKEEAKEDTGGKENKIRKREKQRKRNERAKKKEIRMWIYREV